MTEIETAISSLRMKIENLESYFARWDEEISANPDDPRDRIGRLPGLERVLTLASPLLARLETDLASGDIGRGAANAADTERVVQGLDAIGLAIESARLWQQTDDIDRAVSGMNEAAAMAESCLAVPRDDQPGRFCHDLGRLSEDFRAMASMLELFQRNRRRNPHLPDPDAEDHWPPTRWFEMLLDQACREDRLFSVVENFGLSEESLRSGIDAVKQDEADLEREKELIISSYETLDKREQVYDSEDPESFLNLSEIPELPKDAADVEVSEVPVLDLDDDDALDLPEDEYDDDDESGIDDITERKWRSDPALTILEPVAFAAIKALSLLRTPESEASTLHNYVVLVLLKPLARIASSYVHCEESESLAPVHGAYLFAMYCLDRAATALERFGTESERAVAAPLRGARLRVSEFL